MDQRDGLPGQCDALSKADRNRYMKTFCKRQAFLKRLALFALCIKKVSSPTPTPACTVLPISRYQLLQFHGRQKPLRRTHSPDFVGGEDEGVLYGSGGAAGLQVAMNKG